jgi:hypothetical protein
MKNLLVKCIEVFLIYIILIFKSFKWHDFYRFLSLKVHFTLKNLIFCMDFFINHMFRDIHMFAY